MKLIEVHRAKDSAEGAQIAIMSHIDAATGESTSALARLMCYDGDLVADALIAHLPHGVVSRIAWRLNEHRQKK